MKDEERYKKLSRELIDQWCEEKIQLNQGATGEELKCFEKEINVLLPKDFKYFYSLANGMEEGCSDKYLFHFWSLNYILERKNIELPYVVETKSEIEIPFGDWLIHSHRYFLVCDKFGGSCIKVDGKNPPILLNSFTSFLEFYLVEPDNICLWLI